MILKSSHLDRWEVFLGVPAAPESGCWSPARPLHTRGPVVLEHQAPLAEQGPAV